MAKVLLTFIGMGVVSGALFSDAAFAQNHGAKGPAVPSASTQQKASIILSDPPIESREQLPGHSRIDIEKSKVFRVQGGANPQADLDKVLSSLLDGGALGKTHFAGLTRVGDKWQLREDVKDGNETILQVFYDVQVQKTATGFTLSAVNPQFRVVSGMKGGYAKKSIVRSSFVIEAQAKEAGQIELAVKSGGLSQHPGGLARFSMNDKEFFESCRKDANSSFDTDTTALRELLRAQFTK